VATTMVEVACRICSTTARSATDDGPKPQPCHRVAQRFGFDRELRARLVAIPGMKPSPDPAQP
jgi:hypothetical protein